jgi:hypothetical protein
MNPGAIASGSPWMRQRLQTVALLFFRKDGFPGRRPLVTHVYLAHPNRLYAAEVDWEAGIHATYVRYHSSILSPELQAQMPLMVEIGRHASPALRRAYLRLAHRCWSGELAVITADDLLRAIESDPDITMAEKDFVLPAIREGL